MTQLKAVYLTWGETPRTYGIYQSQVAGTVSEIHARHPDITMKLIAGLPVIHSGLVRERTGYLKELADLRKGLAPSELEICPIPVPQTFVFPTQRTFGVIFAGARFSLLPRLRKFDPDIVHCRSFLASWIAMHLKETFGLRYKVVYDARSLWPEMQYRKRPVDADLAFFRSKETTLVRSVDAVVGVNDPMRDHYAKMGARHAVTNYIATKLAKPSLEADSRPEGPVRLVYAGALYEGGMQTPVMLFRLAAAVRDVLGDVELNVLTTSPLKPLVEMSRTWLADSKVTFKAVRNAQEMPGLLAGADLACNVYRKPASDIDKMLCATGFSTKSAEYLGAGVPVLVSQYPLAIRGFVETTGTGLAFDENAPQFGLTKPSLTALLQPDVRKRAVSLAAEHFDSGEVADRFSALYRHLAG